MARVRRNGHDWFCLCRECCRIEVDAIREKERLFYQEKDALMRALGTHEPVVAPLSRGTL